MKRVLLLSLIVALVVIGAFIFLSGDKQHRPDNLPWQITITPEGDTQVFGLTPGKTTLRQMIERFHSFPETGLFVDKNKNRLLESYFGKKRVGIFEAKLVAELDADQDLLADMEQRALERKAQPSGNWRFTLADNDVLLANNLSIKHLIYIPVADYSADIIRKQFGEPHSQTTASDKADHWFYPDKYLAILLNNDGGDIFYYSNPTHYAALKQRLMTSKPNE